MDVFDLQAALRLDKTEYDRGLDEAKGSAGTFGSVVSSVLGTASKVGLAAITAAAAGVSVLTGKAVSSYATYEQMVGGIETLFGAQGKSLEEYATSAGASVDVVRDKYNTLMEAQTLALNNADNAYKTAGMSANKYMETITSFAAALKQSTSDEVQAAEVANVAVQDMSDNANKMGTNMVHIQDAYQGFAKQNYTMLDNLKLGYGGTKEEMQRLLADAEKISGIHYDISNLSDVFNAIHVIQQELGITGTTAEEAMHTIEGSASMTKAAWENVITAIGRGEGLTEAFSGLSTAIFGDDSGGGLLNNVLPRIQTAMEGIGDFIEASAPLIANKLPELVNAVLPSLLSATGSLLVSLSAAIPGLLQSVWNSVTSAMSVLYEYIVSEGPNMLSSFTEFFNYAVSAAQEVVPKLLETGYSMVSSLMDGFVEKIPEVLPKVLDFVQSIGNKLSEIAPVLIEKGFELLSKLVEGITTALPILIERVPEIISTFANIINDNFPTILMKGVELIGQLVMGIIQAIPTLIANIPQIITAVVDVWEAFNWMSLGSKAISFLKDGILSMIGTVGSAGSSIVSNIVSAISNLPSTLMNLGRSAMYNLSSTISGMISTVKSAALRIASSIESAILTLPGKMASIGRNVVQGLWNGISNMTGWIIGKIQGFGSSVLNGIKNFFGIKSPSRVMRDQVGKMLMLGLSAGVEDNIRVAASKVSKAMGNVLSAAKSAVNDVNAPISMDIYADRSSFRSLSGTSRLGVPADNGTHDEVHDYIERILELLIAYLPAISDGMILDGKKVSRGTYKYDMDFSSRESSLNKRLVGVK